MLGRSLLFLNSLLVGSVLLFTAPAAAQTENDSAIWPFSEFGSRLNKKDLSKKDQPAPQVPVNVPPRPLISGPEDMAAVARGTPVTPYVPTEEIIPAAPADNAPRPIAAPPQGEVNTGKTLAEPKASPVTVPPAPEKPRSPVAPVRTPVEAPVVKAPVPAIKPPVDAPAAPTVETTVVAAPPAVEPAVETVLGTGETLHLNVENDPSLSGPLVVNAVGEVVLPLAGPLKVAGLTLAEAQKQIVSAYANGYFITPKITVTRAK